MRDFATDEHGDISIDPGTHDFAMVIGLDEIVQRIRATLLIRVGEMPNLAPKTGSSYRSFFGKHIDKNSAAGDMTEALQSQVPEIQSVTEIEFVKLPERKLQINFKCTVQPQDSDSSSPVEGGITIDS